MPSSCSLTSTNEALVQCGSWIELLDREPLAFGGPFPRLGQPVSIKCSLPFGCCDFIGDQRNRHFPLFLRQRNIDLWCDGLDGLCCCLGIRNRDGLRLSICLNELAHIVWSVLDYLVRRQEYVPIAVESELRPWDDFHGLVHLGKGLFQWRSRRTPVDQGIDVSGRQHRSERPRFSLYEGHIVGIDAVRSQQKWPDHVG